MMFCKSQFFQSSTVGLQLVSDKCIGRETLPFQQFAHQLERSLLIPAGLNQDIKHLAFTINSAPQVHALAIDGYEHLIKMPTNIRSRAYLP